MFHPFLLCHSLSPSRAEVEVLLRQPFPREIPSFLFAAGSDRSFIFHLLRLGVCGLAGYDIFGCFNGQEEVSTIGLRYRLLSLEQFAFDRRGETSSEPVLQPGQDSRRSTT